MVAEGTFYRTIYTIFLYARQGSVDSDAAGKCEIALAQKCPHKHQAPILSTGDFTFVNGENTYRIHLHEILRLCDCMRQNRLK